MMHVVDVYRRLMFSKWPFPILLTSLFTLLLLVLEWWVYRVWSGTCNSSTTSVKFFSEMQTTQIFSINW